MSDALTTHVALNRIAQLAGRNVTARDRIAAWLAGKSPNTRRAYTRDLLEFSRHLGLEGPPQDAAANALAFMCGLDQLDMTTERGEPMSERAVALMILEGWRDEQLAAGLSSATINRRLSAVNSALRAMHRADMGPGRVDVEIVKHQAREDRSGPGVVRVMQAVDGLAVSDRPQDVRDLAIVLLAAQRGLRRAEIAGLMMQDVNLEDCTIRVVRKGHREKVSIEIGGATCEALEAWLAIRDADPEGAVFVALGGHARGNALSTQAIYEAVRRAGRLAGGRAWTPHGLRHTAITEALRRCNGSLPAAQECAGHAQPQTTTRYIDDKKRLEQQAVNAMSDVYTLRRPA